MRFFAGHLVVLHDCLRAHLSISARGECMLTPDVGPSSSLPFCRYMRSLEAEGSAQRMVRSASQKVLIGKVDDE